MAWKPQNGEVIYPDNLDDIWFGNFLPSKLDGIGGIQDIIDFDDCLQGQDLTDTDKRRFHFVTDNYWGYFDIDYVKDVSDATQAGVRNDCTGRDYDRTSDVMAGDPGQVFTCIRTADSRYAVAGDTFGALYVLDTSTMTKVKYDQVGAAIAVIRITKGYSPVPNIQTFFAWRYDNSVVMLELNTSTGAVTTIVVDLTNAANMDGDILDAGENIVDVCCDYTGRRFVIKQSSNLYFLRWDQNVPKYFFSVVIMLNWSPVEFEMLAMEFVTNDWVLILGSQPDLAAWYKTPKPNIPTGGVLTAVTVKIEGHHKWTHMIPSKDGSYVIAIGRFWQGIDATNQATGEKAMGIYKIPTSSPGSSDITPTLLFSFDGSPVNSSWWGSWVSNSPLPFTKYSCEIYRGKRRFGTNEMWFVTSGRDEILTLGERISTPTYSSNDLTSTTNLVEWKPSSEEDVENVAYYLVERSEDCDTDNFGCVFATDNPEVCSYVDDENPSILPQQRDTVGVFAEVGLVTQADLDDFDPRKDTWPEGRKLWYTFRKVSYLNIESDSAVNPATTKPPIQPVEIDDEQDFNLNFINIQREARAFTLNWDWTPLGSTSSEDFLMWQIAFFEDQNPTLWTGTWAAFFENPQPISYPGTAPTNIWRHILPWVQYEGTVLNREHALRCFVDGVNFNNSNKSRIVDKKYLRWVDDATTDVTDKRYSRLLPDTVYVCSVIGWDKGGLWRASGKMTHVPPSTDTYDNEEMIIDRQVLEVRTESEMSFATSCNFTAKSGGNSFKRWDETLESPDTSFMSVEGTPAIPKGCGQQFTVYYEVPISAYEFYVDSIIGTPGDITIFIEDEFAHILGSVTILSADINTGWNKVNIPTPIQLRFGTYSVRLLPGTVYPVGDAYNIRTLKWPGDTNRDSIIFPFGGPWLSNVDEDLMLRIYTNTDEISEGFVIESGDLLTFDFRRSTGTDGEETIFEDLCYKDESKWTTLKGTAADWSYVDGSIDFDIGASDLFIRGVENDYYGVETRDMLIKTRFRYDGPDDVACWDEAYRTSRPYTFNVNVGNKAGQLEQWASMLRFAEDTEICGISLLFGDGILSGNPWNVKVTLQANNGGNPSGFPILSASIAASAIVGDNWNQFDFGATFEIPAGIIYWIVVEPDACPIPGAVANDYVVIAMKSPVDPVFGFELRYCFTSCIPVCAWTPQVDSELVSLVWGPSPASTCTDKIYETTAPYPGVRLVGDLNGLGSMWQQSQPFQLGADDLICAASIYINDLGNLSGFPWDVRVSIQGDSTVGTNPNGVPFAFKDVAANTLALGWNKFDFGTNVYIDQDLVYWVVVEPVPCPIGSGVVDYIEIGTISTPGFPALRECQPTCIPACIWFEWEEEMAHRLWSPEDVAGPPGLFRIIIHEQSKDEFVDTHSKSYKIEYDLVNGDMRIIQYNPNDPFTPTDWWKSNPAPPDKFPGEFPAIGEWFDIWIKIVDNTISVYVPMTGNTVEENYEAGNSLAKESIWEDGTDIWKFNNYGYVLIEVPSDTRISMDEILIYGRYLLSNLSGGQGSRMDWGDDTESGYTPAYDLSKIYSIEPDDNTEPFDATVQGKNRWDNIDLGLVPAWIDYPEPIAEDDYERQTYEMWVDNAPPTSVLNGPNTGYSGNNVTFDAVGSIDPEGGGLTYFWDFGDGATITTTTPFIQHAFAVTGLYQISLRVRDEFNLYSGFVFHSIQIGELFSDFYLVEFNHPIQKEDVSRDTGFSSTNIPDMCGGEQQDSGPGNRVFNIQGIHTPPRCCCDESTSWRLILDLESICQTHYSFEEETDSSNLIVTSFQTGCCDVEVVPYTGGVGQSFTTTDLNFISDATSIQIKIPMCRTADFDGDIDVKLYCDLLAGQVLSTPEQVSISNADIPICTNGPTEYVTAVISVCPFQIENTKLYVTLTPTGGTAGSFSVISTTPFSDKYHFGEKYLLEDGTWVEQTYEDICMKISTLSDCEVLGCCESKYMDWLWCTRKLIRIDLPCYGLIGAKIVNYKAGKTTNEPFAWIPFTLTIEEIQLEQVGC